MNGSEYFRAHLEPQISEWSTSVCEAMLGESPPKPSAEWVYWNIHLRGQSGARQLDLACDEELVGVLRAVGAGDFPQRGWCLLDKSVGVSPQGVHVSFNEDELNRRRISDTAILMPRLHLNGMPGWHLLTSIAGAPKGKRIRYYVPGCSNVDRLGLLIEMLNPTNARWTLKVRSNAQDIRPDRLVVYIEDSDFELVNEVLQAIGSQSSSSENTTLPLFCWPVADGAGAAPDSPLDPLKSLGQEVGLILSAALAKLEDSSEGVEQLNDRGRLKQLVRNALWDYFFAVTATA